MASSLPAVELTKEAASAFDRYIAEYESRATARFQSAQFIRTSATAKDRESLLHGEIVVEPASGNGETDVESGIIHDWIGGIFIPGANLADVLSILQNYPKNKDYYAPDIQDAKVRSHQGSSEWNVYMRIVKSKFMITDVLNTEQEIRFVRVNADRTYCKSATTKIAEVADAGRPSEHELPVGNDRGLLWRMNGYWFLEQQDRGVYVEYESITLSRNIPFGMGRLLGPILHNVPAESLRSSLEKTRKAVLADSKSTRASR